MATLPPRPRRRRPCHRRPAALLFFWALGLLLLTGAGPRAHAWWNKDWSARKKITVDTSPTGVAVTDPIGTSVVLVRLFDGNFKFADAQDQGGDLRFVAEDDKTALPFQVERFDSILNEAFAWVRVPDLKPGAKTSFWLYYGNPKATRTDDVKGTYDPATLLVYHFAEKGQPPADFSGQGNNAQNAGLPADGALIGNGLRLDGKSVVTIPASPSLAWADDALLTFSVWLKPNATQANAPLFTRTAGNKSLVVGVNDNAPYVEVSNGGPPQRAVATTPVPAGSWHQFAFVTGGGRIALYVDGEPAGALDAPLPGLDGPAQLGGENGFVGELDELEVSKVGRSAGFLKFAALNQGADKAAKALAFGEDEGGTSGGGGGINTGYFGIILKSVTPDGWVVIGILLVMAVFSWYVMANRILLLNQVTKSNALFLDEWRHVALDLGTLSHGDPEKSRSLGGRVAKAKLPAVRRAPLYRIYAVGTEEIRRRLGSPNGQGAAAQARGLSALSVQAIRASLDGALVRESQKLNALIVFLTLSISGGPFLGLLGTVVGVMITFAAIAAAGDVNVNSIAPGIAAALVATVAGLAVAIPALFGYNYLLGRIKDATSNMQVFIDEFVTKMAEFYDGGRTELRQPQLEQYSRTTQEPLV